MTLASRLQAPLAEAFADHAPTRHDGLSPFLSFAPRWQGFGVLEVHDDDDEVTIYFGSFTHVHYGCYVPGLTEEEAADHICRNVIEDLRLVFSDRIEFFAHRLGGGSGPVGSFEDKWFVKRSVTRRGVWSGPIDP